ncbi:MAG: ABC transporter substrate-binding protein, partial [Alphaproteobacteria bacterium]|nr:ABC transporter substrate-binding protein [Alphaproteobacteria bacterium]
MKHRIRAVLALALAVFGFPALAADTVVIGVSLGLTGKYSQTGEMQRLGYELWEAHANATGGMLGRPVKVLVRDDQSDAATAKAIYQQFIESDRVDFVFGPYSSGLTNAVIPLIDAAGHPMLAAGAASDELWRQGSRHIFGIFIPASRYAVGFLEFAAMTGLTSVGIVGAEDLFSQSVLEGSRKWAEDFGLDVVMTEAFKKGERDLSELAARVSEQKLDALVVAGHFNES